VVDTPSADTYDPQNRGVLDNTQQNPRVNHVEMADLTESSLTERRTCVALLHALREWYRLGIDWKVTSRFFQSKELEDGGRHSEQGAHPQ
jgi:hypothetical protein